MGKKKNRAQKENKALCVVSGVLLVLMILSILWMVFFNKPSKKHRRHHRPKHHHGPSAGPAHHKENFHAEPEVVTLSAARWCGYSKKMNQEKDKIKSMLKDAGVKYKLVSDTDSQSKFDKLSKEHNATGFPYSFLLVNGEKVAEFPGYMPAEKFAAAVMEKLGSPVPVRPVPPSPWHPPHTPPVASQGGLGDRLKNAGWAVLVSAGCGHCSNLKKENPDLEVVMVDANSEQGQQLSQKFSVAGFPAFVNLKTGKKQMGYIPRAQIELLV